MERRGNLPMSTLQPGDRFPTLTVQPAGGAAFDLPDALAGAYGVVLFYRGSWCPYCSAQLRAFQRMETSLTELGIKVVALSVDDEATTADLVAKHHLGFPVGYGADARKVAEATGAFVNEDPPFLQSTGFVLDPEGRVLVSVYSSGAIGRLVPDDVIGVGRYIREHCPVLFRRPGAGWPLPQRTHLRAMLGDPLDHVRGPLDAPVTVVEYGDFDCPYCGRAEPVVRELLREFADLTRRSPGRHGPANRAACRALRLGRAQRRRYTLHAHARHRPPAPGSTARH